MASTVGLCKNWMVQSYQKPGPDFLIPSRSGASVEHDYQQ